MDQNQIIGVFFTIAFFSSSSDWFVAFVAIGGFNIAWSVSMFIRARASRDCFWFSDWMRKWRENFKPITKRLTQNQSKYIHSAAHSARSAGKRLRASHDWLCMTKWREFFKPIV